MEPRYSTMMQTDDRLEQAIGHFNAGRWFEAHEAFEDLWRPSEGEIRRFHQGLAQICAGFVKLERGQPGPARTLILKGLGHLEATPPGSQAGLDGAALAAALREAVHCLESEITVTPPLLVRRPHAGA